MLHRDVKTLNIFLAGPQDVNGRHTQYKLGDVGVSKVRRRGGVASVGWPEKRRDATGA